LALTRAAIEAAVHALDLRDLAGRRWFASKGRTPTSARLGHAFALAEDVALALADLEVGEARERYAIPFVATGGSLREAAPGDGAWRALAVAIEDGATIAALTGDADAAGPDAVLVCRPSPGLDGLRGPMRLFEASERALGRDQSNTSVILGERLLLKGYRRIQPGLNPDLELTAYLSEEAGFGGVPRVAGWAEVVTREDGASTVAMLQELVAGGEDAFETTADRLAELILAPGRADLEAATDLAEDLGLLVAGLHAALASPPADAPELAPRPATHDELHAWRTDGLRQLAAAQAAVASVDADAADELRREAAEIAARLARFEAVATIPLVMRIHADLHLGQVLVAPDGYRVVDFEGEPLRPIADRRRPDSPLRDVASMLRSLDHVARSAGRRAARANDGPVASPGLDVEAWIVRSRERFLGAYADALRRSGAPVMLDPDLLDAFEVAKEAYEFVYAATVLPSWLWAPREGMRWLVGRPA
jgi:trehalose synthase-fused probable maltokinase